MDSERNFDTFDLQLFRAAPLSDGAGSKPNAEKPDSTNATEGAVPTNLPHAVAERLSEVWGLDADDAKDVAHAVAHCMAKRSTPTFDPNATVQANGRIELDDDAVRRGVQAGCEVGAFLLCGRPEEDAVRAIVKAALNG